MEAGDSAAPAPADATPRDVVVSAMTWLKKCVDDAAAGGPPDSAAATTTAALLELPVLQAPLDVEAIAAELLHAGSHIRLLQAENKKQKRRLQELQSEVVQLRKAQRLEEQGAPAAAADASG